MANTGAGGFNWQYLSPYGVPQSGSPVTGGGGTPTRSVEWPLTGMRDIIDARRAAVGRTPSAEYPDGYLGNVRSRRDDRLLKNVQSRLTQRSYQRGVHKGERIDPSDYFWTTDVNPDVGLQTEARGLKWTQSLAPEDHINHLGKNHLLTPEQYSRVLNSVGLQDPNKQVDPIVQSKMQRLLPAWK